jgi:DNA-binding response OmpR family regulator
MRVLLVEDQADLARHVRRALERSDHEVTLARDGPEAVKATANQRFDLIILDLNLPGFDGLEVMRRMAPMDARPRVLMLTSRSEVGDRVTGLKAGADDYLTKPFAMEELVARVEALGRRVLPGIDSKVLTAGGLSLDIVRRRLIRDGQPLDLSPREFELLQILMREPGRIFSRGELFERIWARSHAYESKTVEIFIMRLRRKLDVEGRPSVIQTVRGIGYTFNEQGKGG